MQNKFVLYRIDRSWLSIWNIFDTREEAEAKRMLLKYSDFESDRGYTNISSYSEFLDIERKHMLKPKREIKEKDYEYMLEVLPPVKWGGEKGIFDRFFMSEFLTGSYTVEYFHDILNNKYYSKVVDIYDKTTWIDEEYISLLSAISTDDKNAQAILNKRVDNGEVIRII